MEAGLGPGWTCYGPEPAGAYLQDRGDHPAAAELAFGLEAAAVSRAAHISNLIVNYSNFLSFLFKVIDTCFRDRNLMLKT